MEIESQHLRSQTCGWPAALLYYPSEPLFYVYSNLPPASRYTFLYPWIADIATYEIEQSLMRTPTIVHLNTEGDVWGNRNDVYLGPLHTFLIEHYVAIDNTTFIAPSIIQSCKAIQK